MYNAILTNKFLNYKKYLHEILIQKLLIVYEKITDKFLLKNYLIHIGW